MKAPALTTKLLLWCLTALALLSLLLSLVGRTGKVGMVLFLLLFALTAVLCLLVWAAIRSWRKGGRRVFQYLHVAVIGILLAATAYVFVYGSIAIIRFARDRAPLPLEDRFLAIIVVDGANLMQARELLMAGIDDPSQYATAISRNFPNISSHFIQDGAFTAYGVSVWPSSSIPAHTGILTGSYPRRTGVMGQRQFSRLARRHTSYVGPGIQRLKSELSREAKTLYEYLPDVRSLVVLQIANRGSSLYVPTTPHDAEVVKRVCQVVNLTDFLGRFTGRCEIPRILVVTLPDIDHQTHNAPLDSKKAVQIYLRTDEHVGTIIDLYKRKGIYEKTLFVLCSDHGMEEVHNHLTIDNLMHDLRFDVFQSLKWCVVPAWGSFESNFYVGTRRKFDRAYNTASLWGGNSDALLYVKGQRKDADGTVVEESWDIRADDDMLKDYQIGGTRIDVIQRLLDYSPGIGLVLTNPEPHVFNVYGRGGQGQIEERDQGGVTAFRYSVATGQDPLRYDRNPEIHPYIRDHVWLTDQHWLELTYLEHYPDAMRRISHSFENENSATMHIVGADGWDFAPYYVAKHVLVGSHGSLNNEASLVPIMFHGPGIRHVELPYARTVDVLPTVLAYFGVEAPSVDGRPLPVFEDDEKNRAVMNDRRNVFWKKQAEDEDSVYRLEHIYASYDRRIVRLDKATAKRDVLVESVKDALPELRQPADASLELLGLEDGKLVFRRTYTDAALAGGRVVFDIESLRFE